MQALLRLRRASHVGMARLATDTHARHRNAIQPQVRSVHRGNMTKKLFVQLDRNLARPDSPRTQSLDLKRTERHTHDPMSFPCSLQELRTIESNSEMAQSTELPDEDLQQQALIMKVYGSGWTSTCPAHVEELLRLPRCVNLLRLQHLSWERACQRELINFAAKDPSARHSPTADNTLPRGCKARKNPLHSSTKTSGAVPSPPCSSER